MFSDSFRLPRVDCYLFTLKIITKYQTRRGNDAVYTMSVPIKESSNDLSRALARVEPASKIAFVRFVDLIKIDRVKYFSETFVCVLC